MTVTTPTLCVLQPRVARASVNHGGGGGGGGGVKCGLRESTELYLHQPFCLKLTFF